MSEPVERTGLARWTVSFGAVLAAHAVLAWSVLHLQPSEGLPAGEPVMLQLEPPAQQQQQQEDIPNPHGPEQDKTSEITKDGEEQPRQEPEPEQVAEVPPEPEKEPEQTVARAEPEPDPIPPAPPQVTPEMAVAQPEPPELPKPRPEKPVEKKVEKPKPKLKPRREVAETTRPSAASQPSAQAAARSGAVSNNASLASWRAALSAHLQRNKRYPADAQARGESGTAMLTFTIDRNGRVLGSSVGSSGHSALDQEARDLIRRAQPLPAAPADVVGTRFPFSVPIRFTAR